MNTQPSGRSRLSTAGALASVMLAALLFSGSAVPHAEHDHPTLSGERAPEAHGQPGHAAAKSNAALKELAPAVHLEHSYVTGNKTFCVYVAENEDVIRRHAELSGFPATRITRVNSILDPTSESDA